MHAHLPQDVRFLRNGTWVLRRRADLWSDAPFRALVVAFLTEFTDSRGWARSWTATEDFVDAGIVRYVRRGPALLREAEDFIQSRGEPRLVLGVYDALRERLLTVAVPFPGASRTPDISRRLGTAGHTFDALVRL